jgi:hypothetical protein
MRSLKVLAVVGLAVALVSVAIIVINAQQPIKMSLQEAAQRGLVQLRGKGGFLGDKVAIDAINNIAGTPIQITARIGDVLPNKKKAQQALVVTKNLDIVLGPGQSIKLDGLWTMCIQEDKESPSPGAVFDVAPNLADWKRFPAAGRLLSYLYDVDRQGLWASEAAQRRVWDITNEGKARGEFPKEIITTNTSSSTGFTNPTDENGKVIAGVPTLTEWGLIALAVLLAGSLAFMIRRRLAPRPAGA